jgi:hypothetical protein
LALALLLAFRVAGTPCCPSALSGLWLWLALAISTLLLLLLFAVCFLAAARLLHCLLRSSCGLLLLLLLLLCVCQLPRLLGQ